ncbi:peptide ABC transporter ATP-binding protein [Pelagivirga sediminicola]|uniref:Peptide ABC transporter ATP-binding protein n=1 Tax=Pelagivirga sediminicola TaxID=2170575 RepID=A0A2T7G3Y1_9RHOB|nr:ABC transporter ATP-binding protein [Pelagivirga sediminicola]PVA09131.1 peptide ABC transporter ATP-binding protein [Pelagivirga sediminicola]
MTPLLELKGLHVGIPARRGNVDIVTDVGFSILEGEAFGLVGESGSGKSLTALSLIRLLKKPLKVTAGQILFKGEDLRALSDREMRKLRGARIAMIFQEPMTALNPLKTVGRQIAEMFVLHQGKSWAEAERLAIGALADVQVPAPEERVRAYPFQMSGGMRQRVMIAIALACDPDLLIADEPTTALDVTVQDEVLKLIAQLCSARGTAVLLISHDLGVIANMCQRVGVMYSGRLVEERDTYDIFADPQHPYTKGLLGALPRLGSRHGEGGRQRLVDIDSLITDKASLLQEFYHEPRHKIRDPRVRAGGAA